MNPLVNEPFQDDSYVQRKYGRQSSSDDVHRLEVRVTVSYKTLVIAFALFSVIARILDAVIEFVTP